MRRSSSLRSKPCGSSVIALRDVFAGKFPCSNTPFSPVGSILSRVALTAQVSSSSTGKMRFSPGELSLIIITPNLSRSLSASPGTLTMYSSSLRHFGQRKSNSSFSQDHRTPRTGISGISYDDGTERCAREHWWGGLFVLGGFAGCLAFDAGAARRRNAQGTGGIEVVVNRAARNVE
jgi:hypothetical protein